MPAAIEVAGLCKSFDSVTALDHLNLTVGEGALHGLLGPNGAGKTTIVRVLSTLLRPDEGVARVFGADVRTDPQRVRAAIGLTGQYTSVDELLTGRENLRMIGRLFRLARSDARERAAELLERLGLNHAADRPAKTYSGGMRRRLDIAASLMARPQLLFLDEPTTGLDPRSRMEVWRIVRELVAEGTTVLLTTQYLEEADQLADSLSVMEGGRIIARGTPDELKSQAGVDWAVVTLIDVADLDAAADVMRRRFGTSTIADPVTLRIQAPLNQGGSLTDLLPLFTDSGIKIRDVGVRRPTLDDVFLALTGHATDDGAGRGDQDRAQEVRP